MGFAGNSFLVANTSLYFRTEIKTELYRGEIRERRSRLLTNPLTASLLAFPASPPPRQKHSRGKSLQLRRLIVLKFLKITKKLQVFSTLSLSFRLWTTVQVAVLALDFRRSCYKVALVAVLGVLVSVCTNSYLFLIALDNKKGNLFD